MRFGFNDKDIERLAKDAIAEGWRVEIAKGGHVKWFAPDGETLIVSSLTGSACGWRNFKAQVRRAGLSAAQGKHAR